MTFRVILSPRLYNGGQGPSKIYNLLKAIQTTTQDVGNYAPAARTCINFCVPCTVTFQISASPCLQSISSGYPLESFAAKHQHHEKIECGRSEIYWKIGHVSQCGFRKMVVGSKGGETTALGVMDVVSCKICDQPQMRKLQMW